MFREIKNWILDILFPIQDLPHNIELNQTLFCPVCRARLARNVKICHRYAQYKLGAATGYDNELIRRLIWRLKYRGKTGNAVFLSQILIKYLETCNLKLETYTIIPMPLSQKRLRQRGFNQSVLIARYAAEYLKLPICENALVRTKDTPAQAELKDWDKRKENIAGCFGITDSKLVENKNMILVDDVFTSGATMSEAVKTLKSAGAGRIIALVVARAG